MMSGTASCGEVVRSILRTHCDASHNDIDYVELFVDFENAVPTEAEKPVYDMCENALKSCAIVLDDVQHYGNGATDEIRVALHNPADGPAQIKAADTVVQLVARIKTFYSLANRLNELIPNLLWDLCSGPLPPEEQLDSRQALTGQLARIIDFVLEFDAVKMCTPALQNDFSFYRRTMGKYSQVDADEIELANQISLFLASPTPMLSTLSTASIRFVESHPSLPLGNTTDTLATIVSVCRFMVCSAASCSHLTATTRLFCIRVMVGCIILFDHIDSQGAFVRDSPINLRAVVNVIKEQTEPQQAEALLNALRYTTKHFNHSSTPKSAKSILS